MTEIAMAATVEKVAGFMKQGEGATPEFERSTGKFNQGMTALAEHLSEIGKGLEKANSAYNTAVGSLEARILPAARRFKDLGAAPGADVPLIQPIDTMPRALTAPELKENKE